MIRCLRPRVGRLGGWNGLPVAGSRPICRGTLPGAPRSQLQSGGEVKTRLAEPNRVTRVGAHRHRRKIARRRGQRHRRIAGETPRLTIDDVGQNPSHRENPQPLVGLIELNVESKRHRGAVGREQVEAARGCQHIPTAISSQAYFAITHAGCRNTFEANSLRSADAVRPRPDLWPKKAKEWPPNTSSVAIRCPSPKAERWLSAKRPSRDIAGRLTSPRKERLCPPCCLSNTSARTATRKSACGSASTSPSRWRAPTSRPRASTPSASPVLAWSTRSAKSSSFLAAASVVISPSCDAHRPAKVAEYCGGGQRVACRKRLDRRRGGRVSRGRTFRFCAAEGALGQHPRSVQGGIRKAFISLADWPSAGMFSCRSCERVLLGEPGLWGLENRERNG
jgi:hypothetical protein